MGDRGGHRSHVVDRGLHQGRVRAAKSVAIAGAAGPRLLPAQHERMDGTCSPPGFSGIGRPKLRTLGDPDAAAVQIEAVTAEAHAADLERLTASSPGPGRTPTSNAPTPRRGWPRHGVRAGHTISDSTGDRKVAAVTTFRPLEQPTAVQALHLRANERHSIWDGFDRRCD